MILHSLLLRSSLPLAALLAIVMSLGLPFTTGHALETSGTVLDSSSGAPIPTARVRVIQVFGTNPPLALTDEQGRFTVDIDEGSFPVITAARVGYVNGRNETVLPGATDVLVQLRPLPVTPEEGSPPFLDPVEACLGCHPIHSNDWAGIEGMRPPSRHATAGENRWVRDLYDGSGTSGGSGGYVFERDSPLHDSSINPTGLHTSGLCAECHLPTLAALAPVPGTVRISDATLGSATNSQEAFAYKNGVVCGACHKIQSVNDQLGRTGFFGNGSLLISDPGLFFGPLDDAVFDAEGQMVAAYNPLHSDSKVCAPCHEYNMDHDFDGDFDEAGSPPGQMTYSEWLASPHAAQGILCQDCHMIAEGLFETTICVFGGLTRPATALHNHRFEGTTLPFLQAAVDVVVEASREGNQVTARFEVTNSGAGHNFPTGVSVRNAMLVVRARTGSGVSLPWLPGTELIPSWGGIGSASDDYGNTPGRGFAKVLGGRGGTERVLFIDAIGVASNTQIPAGETDISRFRFDATGHAGEEVVVEGQIIYRRAWKDLAEAKGWIGGVDGQGFSYAGDVFVESASATLASPPPTPVPTSSETRTPVPPTRIPTPPPLPCDSGYYLLDSFGGRHPVGAPPVITGQVYFGFDFARDLERATCLATGTPEHDLVVLDGFGMAHVVGNPDCRVAQDFSFGDQSLDDFPEGRAVDLEMSADSQGLWVLTDFGGIYRAGSSKPAGEESMVPNTGHMGLLGFDVPLGDMRDPSLPEPGGASLRAVSLGVFDLNRDSRAEGYIILDSQGGRFQLDPDGSEYPSGAFSGFPINHPNLLLDPIGYIWPFFPGLDIARDMEIYATLEGVVILDGWDGIHPVPVDVDENPVFFATNVVSSSDPSPRSIVGMPYIVHGFDDPTTEAEEDDPDIIGIDAASIFTDLEFATCGGGLYTLDKFGGVFAMGTAREDDLDVSPPFTGSPYFYPFLYAEDMEVFPGGETDFR